MPDCAAQQQHAPISFLRDGRLVSYVHPNAERSRVLTRTPVNSIIDSGKLLVAQNEMIRRHAQLSDGNVSVWLVSREHTQKRFAVITVSENFLPCLQYGEVSVQPGFDLG